MKTKRGIVKKLMKDGCGGPGRGWGESVTGERYPGVEGPGNPSWEKRNLNPGKPNVIPDNYSDNTAARGELGLMTSQVMRPGTERKPMTPALQKPLNGPYTPPATMRALPPEAKIYTQRSAPVLSQRGLSGYNAAPTIKPVKPGAEIFQQKRKMLRDKMAQMTGIIPKMK